MNTPHDGRQNRYSSEGHGGVAGTDELAGAGEGAADTRSGRHEGNYRANAAEPDHAEESAGYDTVNPSAHPGPGPAYGLVPEPPAAEPGPEPPYQSPPPAAWEQAPAEPSGGPLPPDHMPGFGQAYPERDIPPPPDRDFGQPGGAGGGEFGPQEQQQFAYWAQQGFGHQDPRPPYQDDAQLPSRSFEGTAEPDYGQPTESFRSESGGFGSPEYGQGAAGMPPAPPDVPLPPGAAVPPPGEPVHIEDQPGNLAGLRDRPFSSAARSGESPTLVGAAPGARLGAGRGQGARTARMPRPQARASRRESPDGRQAQVTLSRVEPWSVMKFSFVISVVAFIVLFVAAAMLYGILAGLGVFDSLQRTIESLTSGQGSSGVNAAQWFSASRILGYAALIGAVNIILITALSTVGAVLYNAAARLIGGVEVTLDETH